MAAIDQGMCSLMETDHFSIAELPSVVATQVFSLLPWIDKLNAVLAIPTWKACLASTSAWPVVIYSRECADNIYFVKERRMKLFVCIKQYGKYMRHIGLSFSYKIGRSGVEILHAISDTCSNLNFFSIKQELYPRELYAELVWKKACTEAVYTVIKNCKHLSTINIASPFIDWSDPSDSNIVLTCIDQTVAHRLTQLELTTDSLNGHDGYLREVISFTGLRKLTIRREKINNELLMSLVKCHLKEVTLYQDEELPLEDSRQLGCSFWDEVLKICPEFKVDLVLRYVLVIKDSFAVHMPLRSLIVDDLVNIVTKGVIDYLVVNYHKTLESFTYTNSYLENFESGDCRMPGALVSMVQQCEFLHTLQYGFPISSTSLLLIAKARKLKKLVIPSVEVSYELDWPIQDGWSPEFISWLQTSGKNERRLESAISKLLGFRWRLSHETLFFDRDISSFDNFL